MSKFEVGVNLMISKLRRPLAIRSPEAGNLSQIPLICGIFIGTSNGQRTMQHSTKRSTSMTLDSAILGEARRLGINISQAAESGIVAAIRAERARLWKQENAGAISDYNAFIEANGVPLADFRKF